jgi:hypothetical protein
MDVPWTEYQDDFLRRHFRRVETKQIADLLDRERRDVSIRAYELGIAKKRPDGYLEAAKVELAQRLCAQGASWTQLGDALGVDRHRLKKLGRVHGFAVNESHEARRQRYRNNLLRQRESLGIETAGQLRSLAFRRFAERRGWPADLRPRQVQIMDFLYEYGPNGRREIAEAVGAKWKGRNTLSCSCSAGSYLGDLLARGLIVRVRKGCKRTGQPSGDLYFVSPEIRRGEPTTWPVHQESDRTRDSASRRSTSRK